MAMQKSHHEVVASLLWEGQPLRRRSITVGFRCLYQGQHPLRPQLLAAYPPFKPVVLYRRSTDYSSLQTRAFPLFGYSNPLRGHLSALDDDLSSPFLTLSSGDLGNHLLSFLNRKRLDLQTDGGVVVVRYIDCFRTKAQDGVLSHKDGYLGERVVGFLDPSRALDHVVGPKAEGAES